MNKILILLLILISSFGFAQDNYELNIGVRNSNVGSDFKIQIYKDDNNVRIYYYKLNEFKINKIDSLKIKKLLDKKERSSEENQEIYDIIYSSKIYLKDSLRISLSNDIVKISDSLICSKEKILHEINENQNRFILDGSLVEINVKNEQENEYRYFIQSPSKDYYHLIHNLIRESILLYHTKSKKPLLTKEYTRY